MSIDNIGKSQSLIKTGWVSFLSRFSMGILLFEVLSGLIITFSAFNPVSQWSVLVHTIVGVITLLPLCWYYIIHWQDYKAQQMTQVALLGYVGIIALAICALSGLILTWQGLFGIKTSLFMRQIHLITTFITLGTVLPHLLLLIPQLKPKGVKKHAIIFLNISIIYTFAGLVIIFIFSAIFGTTKYNNQFPDDYNYLYGKDKPFAPSLAKTDTGGAFDSHSLAGSMSCGTSGCHEQIMEEWQSSAHRYSAMDPLFQKIQGVMAQQNGPESTRYCGGCHDPISLFSGTKNLFVENLTNLEGYQEGISCLVCHAIRETDLQGNANYVITQSKEYLWQWEKEGPGKLVRDFLIRTYPKNHNQLSKRMFKDPGYCAACHKQFIDEEINKVGWVQLQNQYDNWAASHWNKRGDSEKTVECRECHMPLVTSNDPASGDKGDYNRSIKDGKHRSHRFLAANTMVPAMLKLKGYEKQIELTEKWLQGKIEIPEIKDKWAQGPVVKLTLKTPEKVKPGEILKIQTVFTSNKAGHDFPTGPLDIIQSWLEIDVIDDNGNTVYHSGRRNDKHFIEPGSFIFKAEAVDQYGNLIDKHNLWEMVGVKYKRALFPGYSDTVNFNIDCSAAIIEKKDQKNSELNKGMENIKVPMPDTPGHYSITAILQYRKVDQYLINFLLGEESGLTAPVVEISRVSAKVIVEL